jgi:hypothetical protein
VGAAISFGGLVSRVAATPFDLPAACEEDTLANYIALFGEEGGSCAIGAFAYSDFGFSVLSADLDTSPLASAADILLSPSSFGFIGSNRSQSNLDLASSLFSVVAGESVTYRIEYLIDPHPEIFGFDSELSFETPVFPGEAEVNIGLCIGGEFAGSTCGGTADALRLFHPGLPTGIISQDSTRFAATALLDVRTDIRLDASAGGSSQIDGVNGGSLRVPFVEDGEPGEIIPEPGTWLLMLSGVALAAIGRRRFAR